MKQLMHVKVSGASYFIDSENVIYAGADGVKWICRGMITELSGYPEGLASFKEPDFLKVGGKMVNRARIIAYTNTGVAVDTAQQYFETINYSNDNEYDRLKLYFDQSDYTEIDGYHLVKDKFCSFEPNGMSGALINGQSLTPIKPKPEEVAILTIQSLVDENYIPVSSISTSGGTYRLMVKVEGTNDPVSYVREWLKIETKPKGPWSSKENISFAVYDHHTATEDVMVEMWIEDWQVSEATSVCAINKLDESVLAEYQIAQAQPSFNITSASWNDSLNMFEVNVDRSGSFTSQLTAALSIGCDDMESYSYAEISSVSQTGDRKYGVFLKNPSNIHGVVYLYYNFNTIATYDFGYPQPASFNITSANAVIESAVGQMTWTCEVDSEDGVTSDKINEKLTLSFTDPSSSAHVDRPNWQQDGSTTWRAFTHPKFDYISGKMYLVGVDMQVYNVVHLSPSTEAEPQYGYDFPVTISSDLLLKNEENDNWMCVLPTQYNDTTFNIKTYTGAEPGEREFGASIQAPSFWQKADGSYGLGEVTTNINLPGANDYYDARPTKGETITIYNFANRTYTYRRGQLDLTVFLNGEPNWDSVKIQPGKWAKFSSDGFTWQLVDSGNL